MPDPVVKQTYDIDPFHEVVDTNVWHISETMGWAFELPKIGSWQITKFQVLLAISAFIVTVSMIWLGRRMKNGDTPKGPFWNAFEALYFFVRDDIARAGMGKEGDKYTPFLLCMFLLILAANWLGMFPFMGSPTASIAVTFPLAFIAFCVIHISGVKEHGVGGYIKSFVPHFDLEGGTVMKVFAFFLTWGMAFLEVLTAFIRFAVLAIRLFANILAGHVTLFVILFFITMVTQPHPEIEGALKYLDIKGMKVPEWLYYPVTLFSVTMVTVLSLLEIFIGALQAFIFCLLTAIFIGMAKHPPH